MTGRLARFAVLAVLAASGCAGEGGASEPSAGRSVALGAAPARLSVEVPARKAGESATLTLTDLKAEAQPGVLYRVQVGGTDGPVVGHVNFFNVVTGGPASFSFEAGPALDRLAPGRAVEVVLTPEGPPDPNAKAVVGSVSLTTNDGRK